MSTSTDTAKSTLARMIRARVPVIGIETYEPRRVMDAVISMIAAEEQRSQRSAAERGTRALPRKALYEFTVSRGLRRIATQPGEFTVPRGQNSSEQVQALLLDELELVPPSPDPAADVFNVFQHIIETHKPRVERGAAVIEPAVYVVKDVHSFLVNDAAALRSLRDAAEVLPQRYQTIILLSPSLAGLPPELRKDVRRLEWPLPDGAELRGKVDAFKASKITVELQATEEHKIVEALKGLGTVEADQVLASAVVANGQLDKRAVGFIIEAKAQIIKESGALEYYPAQVGLGDVGGLDLLKDWLQLAGQAQTAEALAFGIKPPRGCLVVGVPGCGKSLTAKMLSSLWQVPLLRLDVGALFGGLVGQSEDQTREALRVATAVGNCVLWIDEIEKGLGSGGGETDGNTSGRVFQTLLTAMEEQLQAAGVFVFATANDIGALKPELVRRFSSTFFVDLPQAAERQTIAAIHLRKSKRDPAAFDLAHIAANTEGFTGSEIEEAVQGGLWAAWKDGARTMTTADVITAAQGMKPLSQTMPEKVSAMRRWAERVRPASSAQALVADSAPTGVRVEL